MYIRAAVLREMGAPTPYANSKPLKIETVELDAPGEGEVLVEIKAAGLCHSDLSAIDGNRARPLPMVLGHEAAGIVRRVGKGVNTLVAGDHVVMVFVPSCGHCVPCAEGRPALCEPALKANVSGTLLSGARRLHDNGEVVNHLLGVAAFAEYAIVSEHSCVKIDESLSFDEAALFGCAVITGVGAVFNTSRVRAGARIAVIGLGGVGLNSLLAAVAAGAREIIAVDLRDEKLALARELGASSTFNADEPDVVDRIRSATRGGVDYAFEMAGSIPALELAWKVTRRGGETVTAGLPHPSSTLAISPAQMVAEERTLKGSYVGSCVPLRDIPLYIELYRAGRLPVNRLLSEHILLEDINAGFDRLAAGATVRQIVMF
jgi:alcohol dehydrogenase